MWSLIYSLLCFDKMCKARSHLSSFRHCLLCSRTCRSWVISSRYIIKYFFPKEFEWLFNNSLSPWSLASHVQTRCLDRTSRCWLHGRVILRLWCVPMPNSFLVYEARSLVMSLTKLSQRFHVPLSSEISSIFKALWKEKVLSCLSLNVYH